MSQLKKEDIAQMDRNYFQSLEQEILVEVACNLRELAVEQMERLEQNSKNSSRPPSSDSPYQKGAKKDSVENNAEIPNPKDTDENDAENPNRSVIDPEEKDAAAVNELAEQSLTDPKAEKRCAGKQPGAQGFWRDTPLIHEDTIPHYPEFCAGCNAPIPVPVDQAPYMGHHVFELEKASSGIRIFCTLHHYYIGVCSCGHETKAHPGEGNISKVEGRKKDLKLTDYVLVGPMFATFIAALSNRHRMSRVKIKEFLSYWMETEISVGTIDRCIREAGVACFPVVEELVKELQDANIVGLDETSWYEKGQVKWLWVAISQTIAVFHIGTRKKIELLNLILLSFTGWLVTDGYRGYLDRERRQRCLAHLIRKAIALTGALDQKAAKMGDWLLKELRGLIHTMTEGGEDAQKKCSPILARLKRACILGEKEEYSKLRALAREILNDWDAVVAFVKNPDLPPTNNEAERALRHAVISRGICFGTRTSEGSRAYAALLSVIETCRLRKQDPWSYIAETIRLGRKGIAPLPVPAIVSV
jgi:transposase